MSKLVIAEKPSVTKEIAVSLLCNGRVAVKGLHSEKTGKKYDAIVVLDDTGGKYVNFKLEFNANGGRKQ